MGKRVMTHQVCLPQMEAEGALTVTYVFALVATHSQLNLSCILSYVIPILP